MNVETRISLVPPESKEFTDKVVVITGGSSGIGRAAAQSFMQEGAHVVVMDIGDKPDFLSDEQFNRVDVGDWNSVAQAVDNVAQEYGGLHIVVNNAAIKVGGNILDVSSQDMERLLRVNALGMWNVAKAALPHLLKSHGTLINVCSGTSELLPPNRDAYFASKGLSRSLTNSLRSSFANEDIQIVGIAPGPTDTDLWRTGQTDQQITAALAGQAGPKVAQPEEIANHIVSLASKNNRSFPGILPL